MTTVLLHAIRYCCTIMYMYPINIHVGMPITLYLSALVTPALDGTPICVIYTYYCCYWLLLIFTLIIINLLV